MLLTDAQLHEIRQIIADHHSAFVANVIHPSAVDPETLERLRAKGLINVKINSVEDSYIYGQLLAALDDPRVAKMGYDELRLYLRRNPVPLSPIEQRAVQVAQHTAAQYAVGLGRRVDLETGQSALNIDTQLQARMRDTIRTATAESIAKRQSAQQLKSDLGWATKDWARDWDRIAITETNNALQRGTADHYAKRFGAGARVAKRVMPDCCEHCRRLYVGPDGQPRIFRLSQLERNGTNHGRKAREWLPVVGSVHPHCQCQLIRVPEGWGFSEEGELVPGGEYGVDYGGQGDLERCMHEELDLIKSVKVGHVDFQGLPIAIENAPGTTRHWKAPDGQEGDTHMLFAYGYVEDTNGQDGDEIDVFLGPDPRAQMVYVIHQQNPQTGLYDEAKTFLGFSSPAAAKSAYLAHFDRPDYFGWMEAYSITGFKRWIDFGNAFKPSTNSGLGNVISGSEFEDRCAFLVKGERFISWPKAIRGFVSFRSCDRESPSKKGTPDRGNADFQLSGDLWKSVAFTPKSSGGFYIPKSRPHMPLPMFGGGNQFQIGGIVVQSIPIFMVDVFLGAEWATQQSFHNNPMLKSLAAMHPDKPILCVPSEISDMASAKWSAHKARRIPKSHKQQLRFVIPLEKSDVPSPGLSSTGNVSPEMVETMASHRAPGPGVGANYLFNTPKRGKTPTLAEQGHNLSPSPREMLDVLAMRHLQGKKDKTDYEFQEPLPDGALAKPIVLPDGWPSMLDLVDEGDIEAKKKQLIKEGMKNTAAVKNMVKVG